MEEWEGIYTVCGRGVEPEGWKTEGRPERADQVDDAEGRPGGVESGDTAETEQWILYCSTRIDQTTPGQGRELWSPKAKSSRPQTG